MYNQLKQRDYFKKYLIEYSILLVYFYLNTNIQIKCSCKCYHILTELSIK